MFMRSLEVALRWRLFQGSNLTNGEPVALVADHPPMQ